MPAYLPLQKSKPKGQVSDAEKANDHQGHPRVCSYCSDGDHHFDDEVDDRNDSPSSVCHCRCAAVATLP